MTCDGCAKDISSALHKLPGIMKVEANVKDQLVSIEGTGSYDRVPTVRLRRIVLVDIQIPQRRHRPLLRLFRPPGETPSYEGQEPQTVSALIYLLGHFPRCFGVVSSLDSPAKADPQIFPEHLLIRSVS